MYGTVRYGLSDDRVTGRLSFVRDAPGGRLTVSGYRDVVEVDPFSLGRTLGNTLNALFVAHDNADYALAEGGRRRSRTRCVRASTSVSARGSSARAPCARRPSPGSMMCSAGMGFPAQSAGGRRYLRRRLGPAGHAVGLRWNLTADVLGGEPGTTGRLYGEIRKDVGDRRGATVRVKAGVATSPTLAQTAFRLGGLGTVRGFEYGTRTGQAFWAAQLDVTPFSGRLRPVAFIDAGQAERPEDLFGSTALAGAGVGLSLFGGALRFDLSYPITPDTGGKVRFDIVVQGAR